MTSHCRQAILPPHPIHNISSRNILHKPSSSCLITSHIPSSLILSSQIHPATPNNSLMSPHNNILHTNTTSCISLKISHIQSSSPSSPLKHTRSTMCNVGARPFDGSDVDATSTGTRPWNIPNYLPHSVISLTQLASTLCNALENLISTMHPNTDLLHMNAQPLQGNFAPVTDECPPQDCSLDEHSGPLPSFLEGIYVRNGPNEQYKSSAAPTQSSHPFDGDGMLHSVSFRGGKATYCCRYVRTSRFVQENAAGQALFPKIFSCLTIKDNYIAAAHMCLAVLRHILGLVDLTKGMGLANTGVVFHHGKLLALGEDDLPYALRIENNGDIVNKGRYTFSGNGSLLPKTMTSHPKIDPVTGEMIFLSYNAFFLPYLIFFRMSPDGVLSKPVPITLEEPSMIHDFAITPHYIIFPETQLVLRPLHMLKGKAAIECDSRKVQRFGVLPRDAIDDSELRWFDVPGCNCFHILNSWEEKVAEEEQDQQRIAGDVKEIVLVLPNCSSPEDLLSGKFDNMKSILTEVRLDLAEGAATQRDMQLAAKGADQINNNMNVEMGTMNDNYRGVKNRYVYMGMLGRSSNVFSGLVKVDFKTGEVVACRRFDKDCYASEPMFVPSLPPSAYINSTEAEEDEGILLCMLHHESPRSRQASGGVDDTENIGANVDAQSCRMLVLDAHSATLDIIASIKLPRRVPYGFHGLFIPNTSCNNIPTPPSTYRTMF